MLGIPSEGDDRSRFENDDTLRVDWGNASHADLLHALLHRRCLSRVVAVALARVERNPLMCAAYFEGDLIRALMEVPGSYWSGQPRLYDRYRDAVRRCAVLRRDLPAAKRMQFWSALVPTESQ